MVSMEFLKTGCLAHLIKKVGQLAATTLGIYFTLMPKGADASISSSPTLGTCLEYALSGVSYLALAQSDSQTSSVVNYTKQERSELALYPGVMLESPYGISILPLAQSVAIQEWFSRLRKGLVSEGDAREYLRKVATREIPAPAAFSPFVVEALQLSFLRLEQEGDVDSKSNFSLEALSLADLITWALSPDTDQFELVHAEFLIEYFLRLTLVDSVFWTIRFEEDFNLQMTDEELENVRDSESGEIRQLVPLNRQLDFISILILALDTRLAPMAHFMTRAPLQMPEGLQLADFAESDGAIAFRWLQAPVAQFGDHRVQIVVNWLGATSKPSGFQAKLKVPFAVIDQLGKAQFEALLADRTEMVESLFGEQLRTSESFFSFFVESEASSGSTDYELDFKVNGLNSFQEAWFYLYLIHDFYFEHS